MFGEKALAQAVMLASHLRGNTISLDFHGVDWEHRTCILQVRPAGGTPFRAEAKVPILSKPRQGDVVQVSNHKTEKTTRPPGRAVTPALAASNVGVVPS
jgi:hypothetical protein